MFLKVLKAIAVLGGCILLGFMGLAQAVFAWDSLIAQLLGGAVLILAIFVFGWYIRELIKARKS